jgi:hypothetical protein
MLAVTTLARFKFIPPGFPKRLEFSSAKVPTNCASTPKLKFGIKKYSAPVPIPAEISTFFSWFSPAGLLIIIFRL